MSDVYAGAATAGVDSRWAMARAKVELYRGLLSAAGTGAIEHRGGEKILNQRQNHPHDNHPTDIAEKTKSHFWVPKWPRPPGIAHVHFKFPK